MADDSTRKVNRDAESGEFVSNEQAAANPKTTVTETVPVGSREVTSVEAQRERFEKASKVADDERLELERMQDAETAKRTASFDQSIKERANSVGVNPNNFETEADLEQAVIKVEQEQADAESK